MGRLVVVNHVTLDGVMQAPARPDEDRRGGFDRGGWGAANVDAVMGEAMGARMTGDGELLLGRRTYEDMASVWPHRPADDPYAAVINARRKHVASRTLREPLEWNATLLDGDVAAAVAGLRERTDLAILGSGELIQSLMPHGLIDEYLLLIHPLVFGTGRRMFPDGGAPAALRLVDTVTTGTGVIIATYRPA
jgi:dihydrofolate reductase